MSQSIDAIVGNRDEFIMRHGKDVIIAFAHHLFTFVPQSLLGTIGWNNRKNLSTSIAFLSNKHIIRISIEYLIEIRLRCEQILKGEKLLQKKKKKENRPEEIRKINRKLHFLCMRVVKKGWNETRLMKVIFCNHDFWCFFSSIFVSSSICVCFNEISRTWEARFVSATEPWKYMWLHPMMALNVGRQPSSPLLPINLPRSAHQIHAFHVVAYISHWIWMRECVCVYVWKTKPTEKGLIVYKM